MTIPRICDPAPVAHPPGYWQSLRHAQPYHSEARSLPDSGSTALLVALAIALLIFFARRLSSTQR